MQRRPPTAYWLDYSCLVHSTVQSEPSDMGDGVDAGSLPEKLSLKVSGREWIGWAVPWQAHLPEMHSREA